jgi:integrase
MTDFESAARAAIATRLSLRTRECYSLALDRWLKLCEAEECDPADPRMEVAATFRDGFAKDKYVGKDGRKRAYKTSTVRNYLAALSFVYRRLMAQRPARASWNPFDPEALMWPAASKIGVTEEAPADAAQRMLEVAKAAGAARDAALIHLLYATGARRMSILSMRRDAIKDRRGALSARIVTKGSGGAALSEVAIPEDAAVTLREWLQIAPDSPWVFPGRYPSDPMDLSMANKIVAKWAKAAGIPRVHPHKFRVSFVTEAFAAGLPWRDIQASVHHADPRSTQRYDRGQRGTGVAEAVAKRRQT